MGSSTKNKPQPTPQPKPQPQTQRKILNLVDFASLTPQDFDLTPRIVGPRPSHPLIDFYLSVPPGIHNGGKLPPTSPTWVRSPQALVFVLFQNILDVHSSSL